MKIKNEESLLEAIETAITGEEIADMIGENTDFMAALAVYFDGAMNAVDDATRFHTAARQFRSWAIDKIVERKYSQAWRE